MNHMGATTPMWSTRRRWLKIMPVLVAIAFQASVPLARAQTASEQTILIRTGVTRDGSLVFRFAGQREPMKRAVRFQVVNARGTSSQPPRAQLTGDLFSASKEGFLSTNRVDISPVVIGEDIDRTNTFTVTVELPDQLRTRLGTAMAGAAFDGSLEILAAGTKASIPVHVEVRPSPFVPFLVLVMALLLGALMRWWAENGRALRIQIDRYQRISELARRHPLENPTEKQDLQKQIDQAKSHLDNWDPVDASASLDESERLFKEKRSTNTPSTEEVVNSHRSHWTWLQSFKARIGRLLRRPWGSLRPPRPDFPIRQRLPLALVPGTIFTISSLAIAVYGFRTQYTENLVFGAAGVSDWINLAGWGFAAGYAGKSIRDYFSGGPGGSTPRVVN
jgi:hypothetical protein